MSGADYSGAGVRQQGDALSAVARHLTPTLSLPRDAEVITGFGHYASALKVSGDLAIAMCTDGVGSKTIVASLLDRYDTIGIDCVAMNVNDIVCIGARPIALVDYLGVHTLDASRADEILAGIAAGATQAGVAVPGGEIAQLPEVIGSDGSAPGDERAFDLVATCVGVVHPDRLVLGRAIQPGDAVIGIASSGLHSNGYTLARRVLLADAGYRLDDIPPGLDRALGDELLEPTAIYVATVTALWNAGVDTRGLVHVTGDGLLNLCRMEAPVGYAIEHLPPPPPIFGLIQEAGGIDNAEMYRVFNMGVGFVVVVPRHESERALACIAESGRRADVIGRVTDGRGVVLEPLGLTGALVDGEGTFA